MEITKDEGIKKVLNGIKKHRFITSVFATFILFTILNMYMIYSFMKILQNV